jgi:magnesium-transporting ATPase (P-type)
MLLPLVSYVVGTILPPLLPTVFTVSVGISEKRLASQRIATANAESILIAGKVTRAFFDKTGTLTKQGLDFLSARGASSWKTGAISEELGRAMATCHNLTKSQTGMLVGNPVDITMFSASGATSFNSKDNATVITDRSHQKVKIVRNFDFDQFRMTQAVIVELADGSHVAIVKGSGESIRKICQTKSLPPNFDSVLRESARAGIYQISVASKPIKYDNGNEYLTRDEVESDLNFIGLLNFQNVMREDTPEVIRQLAEGEIQSIMVTGDSVQTAIQIAQESGIMMPGKSVVIGAVDSDGRVVWLDAASGATANVPSTAQLTNGSTQVALSGAAYEALSTQHAAEAARILPHARVFGRCNPREKVFVVDSFVSLGFITLMCGDGGNDCGALKAAHIGVALSDAE